jgi:uncharacterized protein YkwD
LEKASRGPRAVILLGALVAVGALGLYLAIPYVALAGEQSAAVNASDSQLAAKPFLFSSFGSAEKYAIGYPHRYSQLANFTLGLINKDRAASGLDPVVPSPSLSGQQHADSMLFFGYFSHWDTQGLKPYVRYSLLNGTGAVEENVAFESTRLPAFTSLGDMESAIARLEYQMMNNDSACCDNGHRTNILDPLHNMVSIGIAYNATRLYIVQDFENRYLTLANPIVTNEDVTIDANSSIHLTNVQLVIYHDPSPSNLTDAQLGATPYSGSYDAGEFVGGVVPACMLECESYQNGLTVSANRWSVTNSTVQIGFHLTKFVSIYGSGVYTVYLETSVNGRPEPLFLQSVFVN